MSPLKRLFFLLLCCCLFISGCADTTTAHKQSLFAMDTYLELTAYGAKGDGFLSAANDLLLQLEGELSAVDPESPLYAYNHNSSSELGGHCATLYAEGVDLGARTDGALNIFVQPLVELWGFTTSLPAVPSQSALDDTLAAMGHAVTFGALAKGYAGDQLAALAAEHGVSSALFMLGGNIHCVGSKADGSAWRIAIQNPLNADDYIGSLDIIDQAVVTSGGYERNFTENGTTYHHILDPVTGYPVDGDLLSVTIIADSGTLADGLSTALFVMGAEDALAHWAAYGDFEAILVTQSQEVILTPGLTDRFTLLSSDFTLAEAAP